MIDLDNMEDKFRECIQTPEWEDFIKMFEECSDIYVIGNGGQYPTALHAASDATRLIDNKIIKAFDNMSYLTSVANDFGYDTVFQSWLENEFSVRNPNTSMVVGLSCSGNSDNIIKALEYSQQMGASTTLISGAKSKKLPHNINEVCMNTTYFHSSELISMLLFYEAIDRCGGRCPTLHEENKRKGNYEN